MSVLKNHSAIPVLTCSQCRAVDRYAIEELGIPGVVLMENAGRNAAELIASWLVQREPRPGDAAGALVSIVCGKGNNGGDGFVIARHLANRGYAVSIDLAADPLGIAGDAAVNYEIARRMGLVIEVLDGPDAIARAAQRWTHAAVIVDAILGTGFAGAVRGSLAEIIRQINAAATVPATAVAATDVPETDVPAAAQMAATRQGDAAVDESSRVGPLVVAVDVPSGLDADAGEAVGSAVHAHHTITFLAEKAGYKNAAAREYLGRLTVVDIGAPTELILNRLNGLG